MRRRTSPDERTRLLAILVWALPVWALPGCGSSSSSGSSGDTPANTVSKAAADPAAAKSSETTSARTPVAGPWRAVVEPGSEACKIDGRPVLPSQRIGLLSVGEKGVLTIRDAKERLLFTCDEIGVGSYGCPAFPLATVDADGNSYTGTVETTIAFASQKRGSVAAHLRVACEGTSCAGSMVCDEDLSLTLIPFVETGVLAPLDCSEESATRSGPPDVETYVDFVNTSPGAIKRYWIKSDGTREERPEIPAGTTVRQRGFVGQPWLIADASGTCLGIYHPTAVIGTIAIGP